MPVRLVASFQPSIPETGGQASDAPWTRVGLVVAVHALQKVTQPLSLRRRQGWKPARRLHTMSELPPYGSPNNPLTAFHNVRAALGGPARATRTGTFARFTMSRVRSPMRSQRIARNQPGTQFCELSFRFDLEMAKQIFSDDELEHSITEKFQTLIIKVIMLRFVSQARVR